MQVRTLKLKFWMASENFDKVLIGISEVVLCIQIGETTKTV